MACDSKISCNAQGEIKVNDIVNKVNENVDCIGGLDGRVDTIENSCAMRGGGQEICNRVTAIEN